MVDVEELMTFKEWEGKVSTPLHMVSRIRPYEVASHLFHRRDLSVTGWSRSSQQLFGNRD